DLCRPVVVFREWPAQPVDFDVFHIVHDIRVLLRTSLYIDYGQFLTYLFNTRLLGTRGRGKPEYERLCRLRSVRLSDVRVSIVADASVSLVEYDKRHVTEVIPPSRNIIPDYLGGCKYEPSVVEV